MKFKTPAANSRFAKAGVWCFYESEVLNSSFVHLMKFSAGNPRPNAKPETVSGNCSTGQRNNLRGLKFRH
jgi:hypothetical protein